MMSEMLRSTASRELKQDKSAMTALRMDRYFTLNEKFASEE